MSAPYRFRGKFFELPRRDCVARKVYLAEKRALPPAREELAPSQCEGFIARVIAHPTWQSVLDDNAVSKGAHVRRQVKARFPVKGRWARGSFAHGITLPPWGRNPIVILHELAHVATPGANHQWPFVDAYLRLLRAFVGPGEAENLAFHLRAERLKIGPPERRRLSEEQRRLIGERGRAALAEWRQRRRDRLQATTQVLQEALGIRPAAPSSPNSET